MDNTNIGRRIRKIREWLNISQRELGKILGVSHNTISNYESGDVTSPVESLVKLAGVGNVSVEWVITGMDKTLEKILTPKELELLDIFRQTGMRDQETILELAKILANRHGKEDITEK